ncbi:MAG: polysaccharide biosynthesis protein [Catonella sp.]|uniref:polysaccharide biosynthesis protein n=1 Tax=Catonella sp. TaxID=2382125 RepID=UPI003FA149D6
MSEKIVKFYTKYQQPIKRTLIILYDLMVVWVAGVLALLLRFDLSFSRIPVNFMENMQSMLIINMVITIAIFTVNHLYTSLWAYAGVVEMQRIILASVETTIVEMAIAFIKGKNHTGYFLPRTYHILYFFILLILTAGVRFLYRMVRMQMTSRVSSSSLQVSKVMLVGAGETGHMVIRDILSSASVMKELCCIIDDDKNKVGSYISGIKVVGDRSTISENAEKYNINEIIIAIPSASRKELSELINICTETGCKLKITPSVTEIVEGHISATLLRDVSVEDLLGREPVEVELDIVMKYVSGKTVLVTGGGGSIGSELCRQIAGHRPKQLIIVDIYENNAYDIEIELRHNFPNLNLVVLIASVRNLERMDSIFSEYRPNLVYHAAAHKHVPLMENSPNEAIKNNVLGTYNTAKTADKYGVERFVLISTDKAVNPTNVMGASKRMCEMIIQTFGHNSKTEFVAVRFGNVLGSNGSVIPLFKKQIASGGPVTVTHPDIIRYFMTIPEAVSLVLQAGAYAKGGEIFILEMGEPVKILELARNIIRLSGFVPDKDIKIEFSGLRPGEKLYEELLMEEEGIRNTENKLIHIGRPIEMDEEKFRSELEKIIELAFTEPSGDRIREAIRKIVPTYKG